MKASFHRTILRSLFTVAALSLPYSVTIANAQPTLITSPTAVTPDTTAASSTSTSQTISININGRNVEVDPAPLLRNGSVFVPVRGVLENLGAAVNYDAATARIDITQDGKRYSLKVGETAAAVESTVVTLASAPIQVSGRAFVPLRGLAELFGYQVQWQAATQTVVVTDPATNVPAAPSDHQAMLDKAGAFGVSINFHDANPNDIEQLLDAAQRAGAGLIKFRFDWSALEPTKGSAFQWTLFDRVVRGARTRNLAIVGVLGNTTKWATLYPRSNVVSEWRNSPPKTSELPAWDNYVRRVVGRYRADVQAWQIWENPATYNFRSVAKDYRIVTRRAVETLRKVDGGAVVFAGEPGGVNLGFIEELRTNGLLPLVRGVSLYPVSQWQPGVVANAEDMVLPISTLLRDPHQRNKEYWVHGLSRLSLETADLQAPRANTIFNTQDVELRNKLAKEFTPQAQADYLVRSMVLAMASGVKKVFWGDLRDEAEYGRVDPINSQYGGGLLKRDGTQRPSYNAYTQLTRHLHDKQYVGAVAAGPDAVVLVFEGGGKTVAVAWATPGKSRTQLTFDPVRDPGMPGGVHLETNADSKVQDVSGFELGGASGSIKLTSRPVWLTSLSFKVTQEIRDQHANKTLARLISDENAGLGKESLRAVFAPGNAGVEDGLYWRKYLGFRGAANQFSIIDGKRGLLSTYSRDVMNPGEGQPSIYLDVANDYLFFTRGTPVKVTVEVKRPTASEGPFAPKGGFNLQYDSPSGFKVTPWQVVEGGEGWATYEFEIPDASFANRDGYDLMINTWGTRQDLVFSNITVERQGARLAAQNEAQAAESVQN
jgi:hypothetical protein